jgi:hypothetical protein
VALDPQQKSRLLAGKLAALVRDHAGEGDSRPGAFAGGAAILRGGEAWVLADERPERSLGQAMAWARQQGAHRLHLLAEGEVAGLLARRAACFEPSPEVLRVDGRALVPASPAPLPALVPLHGATDELIDLIVAAGAEPVVEHGVLTGEVLGLEVCRAVPDPDTGELRLEVGVGAHDREAFLMIHGARPPAEVLADVVTKVAAHRRPGADHHPLQLLGAERLLRWRLEQEPWRVGATSLRPAPPPVPRPNVKDPVPCCAAGEDAHGRPLLVVCSTGVDLDLVPFAADARLADPRPGVVLVLALPERDRLPVTEALAGRLRDPARIVAVPPPAPPAPPD